MAVKKRRGRNDIMLLDALKDLCAEKEISEESMFRAIEAALIFACRKTSGADKNVRVDIDRVNGAFKVTEIYNVVKKVTNPGREITLADARKLKPDYQVGDVIEKDIPQEDFGRIAAQAAKQVVMQRIREAERVSVYDEYSDKANDLVNGTVLRIDDGNIIVDIGKTEAVLEPSEQMPNDNFQVGDRVRAYIDEVNKSSKGPQVYLSRTHPNFLRRLFEMEVPEIQEGYVSVKSVAREPGARAKIAVISNDENIDAIGSCVGQHGMRIQAVVDELGDEKIDIVLWSNDPATLIANALSPAKVMKVAVNTLDKMARVVVPNNQLSLAIGKEGQNARLAAKLTGWKIDIKSKSQAKNDSPDPDFKSVKIQASKFFSSAGKIKPRKNGEDELLDEMPESENMPVENELHEENTGA